jgi:hypothetical protein
MLSHEQFEQAARAAKSAGPKLKVDAIVLDYWEGLREKPLFVYHTHKRPPARLDAPELGFATTAIVTRGRKAVNWLPEEDHAAAFVKILSSRDRESIMKEILELNALRFLWCARGKPEESAQAFRRKVLKKAKVI